jgi:hypothetical protein
MTPAQLARIPDRVLTRADDTRKLREFLDVRGWRMTLLSLDISGAGAPRGRPMSTYRTPARTRGCAPPGGEGLPCRRPRDSG